MKQITRYRRDTTVNLMFLQQSTSIILLKLYAKKI